MIIIGKISCVIMPNICLTYGGLCGFLGITVSSHFMQNDDDDIVYMYTGYAHKLMMCFLSHPTCRDKVRIVPQNMLTLSKQGF
jgi:hypothetical protein